MYFMMRPAAATVTAFLSLRVKLSHDSIKEEVRKTYFQVVIRLLETSITTYIIAEAYSGINGFVKPSWMSSFEFGIDVCMKTLRNPPVYYDYILNGTFIERLPHCINTVRDHIAVVTRLSCCRGWGITIFHWRTCKQHHGQRSTPTLIRTVRTGWIIAVQSSLMGNSQYRIL